jgi:hypothetical protein
MPVRFETRRPPNRRARQTGWTCLEPGDSCHPREGAAGSRQADALTHCLHDLPLGVVAAPSALRVIDTGHCYFFLSEAKVGCHTAFRLGAAAIALIFSFLGFLASRLPLCLLFAMSISLGVRTTQIEYRIG